MQVQFPQVRTRTVLGGELAEAMMGFSINSTLVDSPECWPALPLAAWSETRDTLHMWTQIVGKVRLALTPLVNHWWNVPLYVSARGLTTSSIPYDRRVFELQFDFIDHKLALLTSDGGVSTLPLVSRSVAELHREFMELLASAQIESKIW